MPSIEASYRGSRYKWTELYGLYTADYKTSEKEQFKLSEDMYAGYNAPLEPSIAREILFLKPKPVLKAMF